jgi:hypothetical protein
VSRLFVGAMYHAFSLDIGGSKNEELTMAFSNIAASNWKFQAKYWLQGFFIEM